jgi:hypothetical protein
LATPVPIEVLGHLPHNISLVPDRTPPLWRRFLQADRPAFLAFLAEHAIDLIINLRKEAWSDDGGYRSFLEQADDHRIESWDFHQLPDRDTDQAPFATQARRLLRHQLGQAAEQPADYLRELRREPALPTVGVFLGASLAAKRWQPKRWQRAIELILAGNPDIAVELVGGAPEAETQLVAAVQAGLDSSRLTVVTAPDFSALLAWTGRLSVVLSGDTAVLHAASAMGVPSVGLYFSTLGSIWGPGQSGTVLQSPFGARCPAMRANGTCRRIVAGCPAPCRSGVRPDAAADAVSYLLAAAAQSRLEPARCS